MNTNKMTEVVTEVVRRWDTVQMWNKLIAAETDADKISNMEKCRNSERDIWYGMVAVLQTLGVDWFTFGK